MDRVDEEMSFKVNANTADLEEFKLHGGKLILTHGFADPRLPTLNTIAYYERLITGQIREGQRDETNGVTDLSRPICPYPALPRYKRVGDPTKASSFVCAADRDRDDKQPPAPKYVNDGDNYPTVPIYDRDRSHAHDHR